MENRKQPISKDWWSKTLAGAVLGWTLALALAGLFAWFGPDGIAAPQKSQFVMWMIAPIWMLVFSFVYLFRSGARAVLWLAAANLLAYALLYLLPPMLSQP
ncbi:hypothetical protein [Janthinobacterium fluminis]|uniref:Iron uptake protein n=1 Tax=Janthinobacterium fluminis TaxID=2987524 RepID=A0ABT5K0B8_9BURK|nr:hypothetical protein [Janthinobacterium fluminis]MDC8758405.1 hypothetical protein [Janthinobacterium fluminis]